MKTKFLVITCDETYMEDVGAVTLIEHVQDSFDTELEAIESLKKYGTTKAEYFEIRKIYVKE